jgi:hypothetical protein
VERSAGLQPWRRLFHATFGLTLVALVEGLDLPAVPVLTALAAILAAQLVLDAV